MDWLYLLAVQGTLKSLLQHHSSKASILWCSSFFILQLSHPYMTTGKIIAVKRREQKSKGEKERYTYLNAEFKRIARRDKKAFISDQCKEIEESNRMGKTRDLFKIIRDTKRIFLAKMGSIKDRNCRDLREAEDIKKRWQEYTEELHKRSSWPR